MPIFRQGLSAIARRRALLLALVTIGSLGLIAGASLARSRPKPKKLLVVTVTKGFRHGDSIPVSEEIIKALGESSGKYVVDYVRTDDDMAKKMTVDALKEYDGVFFSSTTGDLPLPDREGFLQWIRDGHAFIGTHAAADTFHGFPAYIEMIGGEFKTHGAQVEVECRIEDKKHASTKALGDSFKVFDEIYQFKSYDRNTFHGLIALDKHPNSKEPGDYPIAWCKRYGKGRVFYTALGHRVDVWKADWYQKHVLGGTLWALGLEKGSDALPKK